MKQLLLFRNNGLKKIIVGCILLVAIIVGIEGLFL